MLVLDIPNFNNQTNEFDSEETKLVPICKEYFDDKLKS